MSTFPWYFRDSPSNSSYKQTRCHENVAHTVINTSHKAKSDEKIIDIQKSEITYVSLDIYAENENYKQLQAFKFHESLAIVITGSRATCQT